MARKKTAASIEAEIRRVQAQMSSLQDKYDRLAEQLKDLQKQKRQYEAEAITEAFLKSDKTFEEIMTFLQP